MRLIAIITFLFFISATSFAATWDVRQDGLGDFNNIGDAVDISISGDEILVWPGTYFEEAIVLDHDIFLTSLTGSGTTLIDGQDSFRCFHVTLGASVQIIGFTIQNGLAYDGAGIHVDQGANASLLYCTLKDNNATYTGGAGFVREFSSVLTFESCVFEDNFAPLNAGAVGVSVESTCNFYDCVFARNISNTFSGAIANYGQSLMNIEGCVFFHNSGGQSGAIRIIDSPAVIRNNTFFGNESGQGTIYILSDYFVDFSNNIIAGETMGSGVFSPNILTSSCNIYFDNRMGPTYGFSPSTTDMLNDPLFCDTADLLAGVCSDSKALPLNNNCGLIGARNVGCGTCGSVSIESQTWGTVKALFR